MTDKIKTEAEPSAIASREKGNECIKNENYKEAILHYTEAIKLDPENCALFSNRSLAYFKINQHTLSYADADEAIRLNPYWPKGYYRRGEVEAAIGLYDEALLSYAKTLQLLPDDRTVFEALKKVTQQKKARTQLHDKIPWVCACVGLILGICLVIFFYILDGQAISNNPILQVLFVLAMASCGWGAGRIIVILQQKHIEHCIIKTPKAIVEAIEQLPGRYFIIGLVVGLLIVSADYFVNIIGLVDGIWKMLFTIFSCVIGWLTGSVLRYKELKNLPEEIAKHIDEEPIAEENIPERTSNKYTKAQARYRYKKGKM